MKKFLLILTAIIYLQSSYAQADLPFIPVIPVVPALKAKANLKPYPTHIKTSSNVSGKLSSLNKNNTVSASSKIMMEAGVNEIIQIAVGHLNRIITPYSEPKVTTSSPATTEIRDNVIYIGTTEERPLTMFITEKGSESQALSLTLIPRKIPPREIFLKLKNQEIAPTYQTKKAEKWEKSQPYIATIESLFKGLALGEMPSGYRFVKNKKDTAFCKQEGLSFNFKNGQTIAGHNLIVQIGVITNTSPESIEFIESTCGNWDVAAVSSFPKIALKAGEKTEVFVAKKKHYRKSIKQKRQSLLSKN